MTDTINFEINGQNVSAEPGETIWQVAEREGLTADYAGKLLNLLSHEDLVQSVFPYYSQQYIIDDHTGTQVDYPAHFIPPPGAGMPFESEMGWMTGDKYPLERQMGPAVVFDVSAILDKADNAKSPLITIVIINADEAANGATSAGDVVLFYSGFVDQHYMTLPAGNGPAAGPRVRVAVPAALLPRGQDDGKRRHARAQGATSTVFNTTWLAFSYN